MTIPNPSELVKLRELVERLKTLSLYLYKIPDGHKTCDKAAATLESQATRIAELEAALAPFANALWPDGAPDDQPVINTLRGNVTVSDFRRATLSQHGEGEE